MNAIILLSALSAGQPPGVYLPPIPQPGTAAQPPMTMPMTQPMAQPPMGMPPAANGNGNGNGNSPGDGNSGAGTGDEAKAEEPAEEPQKWFVMRSLEGTSAGNFLDERGITISGWLAGNYSASTASRNNLPLTFNDRGDFWQFNQNYLKIEKAVDTSKDEFQLGGRADFILPGTDARFSIARGFLDGQLKPPGRNGALPNYYPIDIFQLYTEAFLPNLGPSGTSVKFGRFATHVGYELVQAAETPFLQRSYLFQYNPFTHTGLWATTQLNDTWSMSNGLALGADNFFGAVARLTYLGQLKWAPKDGKTNALLNVVITNPNFSTAEAFPFYNVYNMVLTHNFTDKLTYVADATFSHLNKAPLPSESGLLGSATWYGAAQYLIYKHTDQLTSTMRVELFEDTKGFRTGFQGLYTEVTYGMAYAPMPGLIFRPSVRYDHNNTSRPFEGKPDLFTAAMEMIVRY